MLPRDSSGARPARFSAEPAKAVCGYRDFLTPSLLFAHPVTRTLPSLWHAFCCFAQ